MNCSPPSAETPRPEYSSSSTLTQRPPEYSSSSNGQHRQVSSPTSPVQELGSFSPPSFMLASEYSPAPWIYTYEASVADASIRVPNSVGSDVEFESSGPSALDSAKPSRAESSLLFQHTGTTGLTREGNLSNSSDSRLLNAVSDGRATLSNTPPKIPVKDRVKLRRTCDYCKSKKIKCSGFTPCTRCSSKGFECVFSAKLTPGPKPITTGSVPVSTLTPAPETLNANNAPKRKRKTHSDSEGDMKVGREKFIGRKRKSTAEEIPDVARSADARRPTKKRAASKMATATSSSGARSMNGVDQEPSLHYRERSKLIDKAIREARNKASRAIIALDEAERTLPIEIVESPAYNMRERQEIDAVLNAELQELGVEVSSIKGAIYLARMRYIVRDDGVLDQG